MIDKPFAARQISRMAGLANYPHEKAATDELTLALQCASSDHQAKKIVDDWIATEHECPKPADLRRICFAEDHGAWQKPNWDPPQLCPRCQGYGNVQLETGEYVRCDCENGREFPQILLDMLNHPRRPARRVPNTEEKLLQMSGAPIEDAWKPKRGTPLSRVTDTDTEALV